MTPQNLFLTILSRQKDALLYGIENCIVELSNAFVIGKLSWLCLLGLTLPCLPSAVSAPVFSVETPLLLDAAVCSGHLSGQALTARGSDLQILQPEQLLLKN